MSQPFNCEDKELLVAYLYDEAEPADRERVETHLSECASCREEVAGLRSVRTTLAEWAPATRALGYRLIQTDPAQEASRRRLWPLPAWAQAAAAVLVIGIAAGLANLDITAGSSGVTVRTGWRPRPAAAQPAQGVMAATAAAQPWRTDLAALEQKLRSEFAVQAASAHVPSVAQPAAVPAAFDQDQVLGRVRALVAESEQRQQRELALRVAQLQRDFDGQRVSDLKRIQDNLGQLSGWTGAEVARQRDVLNYLLRVNQQQVIK
jgi:anti-sigma factor RsiW